MAQISSNRSASIIVSPKAEKSIARRHPWIFSGAVLTEDRAIVPGSTVAVRSANGNWLAWGAYSPQSQIRVRIWSFIENETIDPQFFGRRIDAAVAARSKMPLSSPCTALRLINAESDGLPGVIVDRYNDYLVCQFLTTGAEFWKATIVELLHQKLRVQGVYERSDVDVRAKEGLVSKTGLLWGDMPSDRLRVRWSGIYMLVDVLKGHKTGLYLDQRENQARIAGYAKDAQVLNCFSYTGGFGVWALSAGAKQVTHIDASADTLAIAEACTALNANDSASVDYICGNVFEQLRRYRDGRRQFDLIVLDPPKFVASAGQMKKGSRGYKDINLLAFKLLRPGGILMTFSCSGLVSMPLFQKIVADAATDAQRSVRMMESLSQAADHPVALNFPEGLYLKGLVCQAE